jgi:hypothetical protein
MRKSFLSRALTTKFEIPLFIALIQTHLIISCKTRRMFSLKHLVLFMISMNCIQSIGESEYCTQSSDAENIFNIFDRVYIRTKDNNYWSYDSINQQLDEKPIDINDMFRGIRRYKSQS